MTRIEPSRVIGLALSLLGSVAAFQACGSSDTPAANHDNAGGGGSLTTSGGTSTGAGGSSQTTGGGSFATDDSGASLGPSKCDGLTEKAAGTCSVLCDFESASLEVPKLDHRGAGGKIDAVAGVEAKAPVGSMATLGIEDIPASDANAMNAASRKAIHFTTKGFADWGASFGISFGPCYDVTASGYTGIKFWAKAAAKVTVLTGVHTAATHGSIDCTDATKCWGAFRTDVAVDTTWKLFTFTWDQLHQPDWALQVPFDRTRLISMIFSTKDKAPVDVWIDDPGFAGGNDSMCTVAPGEADGGGAVDGAADTGGGATDAAAATRD